MDFRSFDDGLKQQYGKESMQEYMFKFASAYQILIIESSVLNQGSIVVTLVLPENLTYSAKTFVSLNGMYLSLVFGILDTWA